MASEWPLSMPIDVLRARLMYDPNTGELHWRACSRNGFDGKAAGSRGAEGINVHIDRRKYKAHRVAWAIYHGVWPRHGIDHIDGDPYNNRIANLRDVPQGVNTENLRRPTRANTTGYLGVSKIAKSGRYRAKIQSSRKTIHLGEYDSPEIAHAVYVEAKRKLHEGCAI